MSMRRTLLAGLMCLAAGCGGGGGGGSSPTEPERRDTLVVLNVQPAEGAKLQRGDFVDVTARVRYTFVAATRGTISIIALPLPFGLPVITQPFQFPIEGGQGETTLRFTLYLDDPDEPVRLGPFAVRLALFPEGVRTSTASVQVRYEIVE